MFNHTIFAKQIDFNNKYDNYLSLAGKLILTFFFHDPVIEVELRRFYSANCIFFLRLFCIVFTNGLSFILLTYLKPCHRNDDPGVHHMWFTKLLQLNLL
jgi:hypothetical protein